MLTSLVAWWLGSMFIYSAGLKFARYERAGGSLVPYAILPRDAATLAGFALPWLELATGLTLVLGVLYPAGPILTIGLGMMFAYGSLHVLRRGGSVPCGCTGGGERVTRTTFLRAVTITAGGSVLAISGYGDPVGLPPAAMVALVSLPLMPGAFTAYGRVRSARLRARDERVRRAEVVRLQALIAAPPRAALISTSIQSVSLAQDGGARAAAVFPERR